MKKDLLENIEETREKRKLTKEAKKKIRARLRANFFVFLSIALLIIAYVCIREYLPYEIAICTYDICAVVCLLFNIILVEVAYRKNSVKLIVMGLEICAVSVFSLFSTYVYYKLDYITISLGIICGCAIYYIIKIIVISITDKRKYLYEMSDFSEIIRKESKDKNVAYEKENRMKIAMEERRKLMENIGKTHDEIENTEEVKPKARVKKGKKIKEEATENREEEINEPKKAIASETATENKKTGSIARRGRRKKTENVQEEPIAQEEPVVQEKTVEPKKEKKATKTPVKKNSKPVQIEEEPIVKKTTRGRKPSTVKEEVIEEKPKAKKTTTAKTKKEIEEVAKPKTKKTTTTTKKTTTSRKPATKTSTATKKTTTRTTKKGE